MAAIGKTTAVLRFFGEELDPREISVALGLPGTVERRAGDTKTLSSGRVVTAKEGAWMLQAPDHSPGALEAQIIDLLSQATSDLTTWGNLRKKYEADIFCGMFMAESNEGADLSSEVIRMLSERGLTLRVDIYAPLDE